MSALPTDGSHVDESLAAEDRNDQNFWPHLPYQAKHQVRTDTFLKRARYHGFYYSATIIEYERVVINACESQEVR